MKIPQAHSFKDSRGERHWQSLAEHSSHVARLCREYAGKIDLPYTGYLTGLLHDAGKIRQEFQDYLETENLSLRGKINHSSFGLWLLKELPGDTVEQRITKQIMGLAICSHHGGFIDCITPDGSSPYEKRQERDESLPYDMWKSDFLCNVIYQMIAERESENSGGRVHANRDCEELAAWDEIVSYYNQATEEVKVLFERSKHLKFFGVGMIAKFLFSALVDADRYDTYCFEAGEDMKEYKPFDWRPLQCRLEEKLKEFGSDDPIDILRREVSEDCYQFASHPGGVYQLYGPTGSGKTLASLRYALTHCVQNREEAPKEHVYYIIPYCSILDQNSTDIRNVLGLGKNDETLLEHHSNVIRETEGGRDQEEQFQKHELLTERWTSPIVMTTMVQFLNTIFSGGTKAIRRLHQLSHSVLIFDEIQALPVKCIYLFNMAINFLSQVCGTTIVLCTATQPQLSKVPVPLLLSQPADIVPDFADKFRQFQRTRVCNRVTPEGMSYEELARFSIEKMEEWGPVLIIVNTKEAARTVFNLLQERTEKTRLIFLSTGLCPNHRKKILDNLQPRPGERIICVSTQLVEAGVDKSFGCVIRSLAGLDSIAQAAGRCNRSNEYGKLCDVYIVRLREENLDKLPEIKAAQVATESVLHQLRQNLDEPDQLLSPKVIEAYYGYYYYERLGEMGYKIEIEKEKMTLFELLNDNKMAVGKYARRNKMTPPFSFYQAFETAGNAFEVIDNKTVGVIVPYGKGRELIADLKSSKDIREKQKLLRQAQQYTVNLYEGEKRRLEKSLELLEELQVYVLIEGFYDEKTGICENPKLDFLCG